MSYKDTFIQIADDCPVQKGTVPPARANKPTIAEIEFKLLRETPYGHDHDSLTFALYKMRMQLAGKEAEDKDTFLRKGRPCLRASPLTKRLGWGAHYDAQGKIALYGAESSEYERFCAPDNGTKLLKAMRSKRA